MAQRSRAARHGVDGDLDRALTLYVEAALALAEGNAQRAVRSLESCVALRPAWSQPHTVLGYAWSGLGRPERAEAEWRVALALNAESWQAGALLTDALSRRDPEEARTLAAALLDRYGRRRPRDPGDPSGMSAAAQAVAQATRAGADGAGQRSLAEAWRREGMAPGALGGVLVGLLAWTEGDFAAARRHWRAAILAVSYPPALEGLNMLRVPPDEGLRCLLRGALWLAEICQARDLTPPHLDFPLPTLADVDLPLKGAWEAVRCLGAARGTDAAAGRRAVRALVHLPEGPSLLAAVEDHRGTPRRVRAWIAETATPRA